MGSRFLFLFLFYAFSLLLLSSPLGATCIKVNKSLVPTGDSYTNYCTNTIPSPRYIFWTHDFETGKKKGKTKATEGLFSGLIFDPRGAGVICNMLGLSRGREEHLENNNCIKTGIRKIKRQYKSANTSVTMIALDNAISRKKFFIDKYYENKKAALMVYPEKEEFLFELAEGTGCFVHVSTDERVTLGYFDNAFSDLVDCLMELEDFFSKNKRLMLKLSR